MVLISLVYSFFISSYIGKAEKIGPSTFIICIHQPTKNCKNKYPSYISMGFNLGSKGFSKKTNWSLWI